MARRVLVFCLLVEYLDAHEAFRTGDAMKRVSDDYAAARDHLTSEAWARSASSRAKAERRALDLGVTLFDAIREALPENRRDELLPARHWAECTLLLSRTRVEGFSHLLPAFDLRCDEPDATTLKEAKRSIGHRADRSPRRGAGAAQA